MPKLLNKKTNEMVSGYYPDNAIDPKTGEPIRVFLVQDTNGRPAAFATPEDFRRTIEEYVVNRVKTEGKPFTIDGLCAYARISRHTFDRYMKDPNFAEEAALAMQDERALLVENIASGNKKADGFKFLLKTLHNFDEGGKRNEEVKNPLAGLTLEQLNALTLKVHTNDTKEELN